MVATASAPSALPAANPIPTANATLAITTRAMALAHAGRAERSWRRTHDDGRWRNKIAVVGVLIASVEPQHPADVVARLGVRRYSAVPVDGCFTRVVGGGSPRYPSLIVGEEPAKIGKPAALVLVDVIQALDPETGRRLRDELHQSRSALAREWFPLEIGFDRNARERQTRIDGIPRRQLLDGIGN